MLRATCEYCASGGKYFYSRRRAVSVERNQRTKVHQTQSRSGVLKRLFEREKQLTHGKAKWKSRLSHYLLTIHYWIRYTRFRIPIAEKFPAPRTVSVRIVSTNKHANIRQRTDLRRLFVCALIRILEINPTPKGRVGPAGVFV